jgi:hypothetical protein
VRIPESINVVEPTLMDETGHCYSFISALCKAGTEAQNICLWVNRHAKIEFNGTNIRIRKYFFRKFRRLQSLFLYRKLLAMPDKLFISTAGRTDLLLIDWAAKGKLPPSKVYMYFHWFNPNEEKIRSLMKVAQKQPNLEILGPTLSVVKIFQEAGFGNAHIVPYPISMHETNRQARSDKFSHILYAGAARQDKGISEVVSLVEFMNKLGLQIPFRLQSSPDHHGKYDAVTKAEIQRLEKISYPYLRLYPGTLKPDEYARLFAGAICIQLYNADLFYDRVSGVTLDALTAGSPIVATAGTWTARMVQRFDAGRVIDNTGPENVLSAVQEIISEYPGFSKNAYAAGQALQQENSAVFLFNTLVGQYGTTS